MLHHQLIKLIKQSQEVEAPQNAQTQQPQASTSNNSQVTATPTESKAHQKVHQ